MFCWVPWMLGCTHQHLHSSTSSERQTWPRKANAAAQTCIVWFCWTVSYEVHPELLDWGLTGDAAGSMLVARSVFSFFCPQFDVIAELHTDSSLLQAPKAIGASPKGIQSNTVINFDCVFPFSATLYFVSLFFSKFIWQLKVAITFKWKISCN